MNEGTFVILYVITFLVVGLLCLAPLVVGIVVVLHILKKKREQESQIASQAMAYRQEKQRLEEEQLMLKKMKYKRVRCVYCDSFNPLDRTECIGCGASLQGLREVK